VLKQLVAWVGRDNFLAGVQQYFAEHSWGNATLGDLLGALEQFSGRELASWSKAWLETAGVNTLRPRFEVGPDGRFTSFAVLQEAPASHPELRPHRIAIGLYRQDGAGLSRVHRVETDIAGESTVVDELVGLECPDLVLVNDDDLTYAKIRLDERSQQTLLHGSGWFTDDLPAAIAWAAAWDMVRDGELRARDFLAMVLARAQSVTDVSVLRTILMQVTSAVRRYADPAWRTEGLAALAGALRDWLTAATPGSDAQLTFARALADVASSRADLDLLAGLLDGSADIDGLAVDTELRWLLLHRLVAMGEAGEEQIDTELDNDRTDAGERHAIAARAAIPTPEAKARAWDQIVGGTLPNAMFRAALNGFQDMDQTDLLAPFAEPFFEVVADLWARWGSDQAQYFATSGYPVTAVTQATLDRTDVYLETAAPPAPLRRLLSEDRDDIARQLRCRQRDTQAG